MIGYYLAVGALAALNLASIALLLWMHGRLRRVEARLLPGEISASIPTAGKGGKAEPAADFAVNLLGSEMQRRLQDGPAHREPPEKYRFIASLASQGMSSAEIARVLHLAPGEVEQVLNLARLSREAAPAEEKG